MLSAIDIRRSVRTYTDACRDIVEIDDNDVDTSVGGIERDEDHRLRKAGATITPLRTGQLPVAESELQFGRSAARRTGAAR